VSLTVSRVEVRNVRSIEHVVLDFDTTGVTALIGRIGTGKCLPGDTPIFDAATGESIPIEQFVRERRKMTLGLHGGRIGPVRVKDWMALGTKPTVTITLRSGSRIRVATTHPILTDQGCVPAGELTSAHWVAEAARLPQSGPSLLAVDEAFLAGLLLGDGCLQLSSVSFTSMEGDCSKKFTELVERILPGATVHKVPRRKGLASQHQIRSVLGRPGSQDRADYARDLFQRLSDIGVAWSRYYDSARLPRVERRSMFTWDILTQIEQDYGLDLTVEKNTLHTPRAAVEWAKEIGLSGHSGSKRVPQNALLMPDEQVWAILAGLWMTDGWVFNRKKANGTSQPEVALVTKSRGLADDIRMLFIRVGIRTTVHAAPNAKLGTTYWRVSVSTDGIRKMSPMPLVGPKAAALVIAMDSVATTRPSRSHDMIPPAFTGQVRGRRSTRSYSYSANQLGVSPMSREVFRSFVPESEIAAQETNWSPVVSVEATELVECFDIEVDTPEHLYLAQSFVVHNSTALEIIPWVDFGTPPPGVGQGELRRLGAEGAVCRAEVTHTIGGVEVRSVRGLTRKVAKDGTVSESAWAKLFLDGTEVTQVTPSKLTAKMTELTGLTGKMFRSMQYIGQSQLPRLAEGTPGDIAALIEELTGITPLTKAIEGASKTAGKAEQAARALPGDPAVLAEYEQTLTEANDELAPLAQAHASSVESAVTAAGVLSSAAVTLNGLRARRERSDTARSRMAALSERRDSQQQALADADAELAEQDGTLGADFDPALTMDLITTLRGLTKTHVRTGHDLASATTAVKVASADLEDCVTEAGDPDGDTLATLDRRVGVASEHAAQHTATVGACVDRIDRLRRQIVSLRAHAGDATCPTCSQPIPDVQTLIDHLKGEGAAARVEEDAARAKLAKATAKVESLTAAVSRITQEHARRRDAQVRLDRETARLRDAQAAHSAARTGLLDVLGRDQDVSSEALGAEAEDRVATLTAMIDTAQRALTLRARRRMLGEGFDDTCQALTRARAAAADTVDENDLLAAIDAEATARVVSTEALAARAAAAAAVAAVNAKVEHARSVADAEAGRVTAKKEATRAAECSRASVSLLGALRRDLLTDYTAQIADAASDLLSSLDCEHVAITLDDSFAPGVVRADGSTLALVHLSGGEKYRAAMCLRLGITAHIAGGGGMPMIFGDEITAAYDSDTREAVVAFLSSLGMPMVLVGHTDEVLSISSRAYTFSKTSPEAGSRIRRSTSPTPVGVAV